MSSALVTRLPPFFEEMAAALKAVRDWPRLALFLAWYGQLVDRPGFWRGMTPNHLIQSWSALYVAFGDPAARAWLLSELREQRTTGLFRGEQLTQVYPTYYVAAVVAVWIAALERRDDELAGECESYLAAVLALWSPFVCPSSAHRDEPKSGRDLADRVIAPGCRCGDRIGADYRTDVTRLMLLGLPIPGHWRLPDAAWSMGKPDNGHVWMETMLVMEARRVGLISKLEPAAVPPPILSECVVEDYENGRRAYFSTLDRCAGFPLWSNALRWSDGASAAVGWEDVRPRPRKPSWMGLGKPALPAIAPPATLPGLGALVGRVTLGPRGTITERPAPPGPGRPGPPAPPPPPERPAPRPGTATWSAAGGRLLVRLGGGQPPALEAIESPDPGLVLQLRDTVDQARQRPASIVFVNPNQPLLVEGGGAGTRRHLLDVEVIATRRSVQLVVETHGDRSGLYYIREHRP